MTDVDFKTFKGTVKKPGVLNPFVLLWMVLAGISVLGMLPPLLSGTLAFALSLVQFYLEIGKSYAIRELTVFVAGLQWMGAAVVGYLHPVQFERYQMYVPQEDYFQMATPACCLFAAGLTLLRPIRSGVGIRPDSIGQYKKVAVGLILVSFPMEFVGSFLPSNLAFLMFLLSQFRYVGMLLLLEMEVPGKWKWILLALVPLLVGSGESAMFHDLLLWIAFAGIFAMHRSKFDQRLKLLLLVVGILFVTFVQSIKGDYRQRLLDGERSDRITAMTGALQQAGTFDEKKVDGIVTRFNQGWIVSAVMANVPRFQPFAEGTTLREAAYAALVPRILDDKKATVSGRDNFNIFTGLYLMKSTSMALSPLGEMYANFGPVGGALGLGCWGLLLGLLIHGIQSKAVRHPLWNYLLPLVIYQGIKAETEFLTIFNQLTKGYLVAWGAYWIIGRLISRNAGGTGAFDPGEVVPMTGPQEHQPARP